MIELKGIDVQFDSSSVLKNFTLSVAKGDHIALMGPSGSGKTTVLKLIAKLLKPNAGDVQISSDKVSYMFQEPRLVPWLTAAENVNLVLGDNPESLPEAIKWLKKLGLENDTYKYPHELSGGMQQRVALARALAYNGDILLLDEPFSAVDENMANELISLLKTHTQDKTVVLVTHSTAHAKSFADTIYVIKKQNS